jgi:hypothetical protein
MLKLYKRTPSQILYWETWDNDDGSHTVHWGSLGAKGESKTVRSTGLRTASFMTQEFATGRLPPRGFPGESAELSALAADIVELRRQLNEPTDCPALDFRSSLQRAASDDEHRLGPIRMASELLDRLTSPGSVHSRMLAGRPSRC